MRCRSQRRALFRRQNAYVIYLQRYCNPCSLLTSVSQTFDSLLSRADGEDPYLQMQKGKRLAKTRSLPYALLIGQVKIPRFAYDLDTTCSILNRVTLADNRAVPTKLGMHRDSTAPFP